MAPLVGNVYVEGQWYGPSYGAAGDPPAGAVTNPSAWEDGVVPEAPVASGHPSDDGAGSGLVPPPMSGPGSSAEHWREYAKSLGVSVEADAKRGDIVKEIADAGFRVE